VGALPAVRRVRVLVALQVITAALELLGALLLGLGMLLRAGDAQRHSGVVGHHQGRELHTRRVQQPFGREVQRVLQRADTQKTKDEAPACMRCRGLARPDRRYPADCPGRLIRWGNQRTTLRSSYHRSRTPA